VAKPKPASTQEHLRIAEIRDGVVILASGELRQVLLVSSVNFALKSEDEQNAIIFQFQNFLNSLTFPIQIVVQSRRLDLAPYLGKLQERLDNEQNELIRLQIADYMEFIKRLVSVANIMDKHFLVVIPFSPPITKKGGVFAQLFGSSKRLQPHFPADQFAVFKQHLAQRVGVITAGLSSMGLKSALLSTQQLVELFYAAYNPEEATKERLTYTQLLSAPVVRREGQPVELGPAPAPPATPSADAVPMTPEVFGDQLTQSLAESQNPFADLLPPPTPRLAPGDQQPIPNSQQAAEKSP
jgi:hypothetical protein